MKTYLYYWVMGALCLLLCVFTAMYGLNRIAGLFGFLTLMLVAFGISDYKTYKK